MPLDVDALYRRYGSMVQRRCRHLLRDEQAAAEATQDVFVELVRRSDRLDAGAPSALLYRIATNTCLNRLRSKRRRPEDAGGELVERIASAPDPSESWLAALTLERIFQGQQTSTRTMAVLHLLDGMTLEEVADTCEMSVSGVRKRLRTLKAHVAELEGL